MIIQIRDLPPAALFYAAGIGAAVCLCLTLVLLDVALWFTGAQTMSGWLRRHPLCWALPVLVLLVALAAATLHLLRK